MADIIFLSKEGLDRYDNKMKNYIGIELTKAEYDALSEEEKNKGTYWITDDDDEVLAIELDKTLSIENTAADAKSVGDALKEVNGIELTQEEYDALSEEEKITGIYWITDSNSIIGLDKTLSKEGMAADAKAVGDTLEELKKSVSDGKTLVAGAITDNGVETATDDTFEVMAENINLLVNSLKVPNGTEWTLSNINTAVYNEIWYFNNLWLCESSNSLYYSEDGKTWTKSNLTLTNLNTVLYIKDMDIWLAYSGNSSQLVYYSLDGKSWTPTNITTEINKIQYADYILVACTSDSNNSKGLYYSEDGKIWTQSNVTSGTFNDIRYINNIWFTVSTGSTPTYYSTNGKTWNTCSVDCTSVQYKKGLWICHDSSNVYYSTNGINWSICSITFTASTYGKTILSLNYHHNVWVITTYYGLYYSTDGKTWTATNITTGSYSVMYTKGKWVASGQSGPSSGSGVYYSEDGKTWIQSNLTGNSGVICLLNDILYFYTNGGSALWYSLDGKVWTLISNGTNVIYYSNGVFIGSNLNYSINGISLKSSNVSATTYKVFHEKGIWVASTNKGIYYSPSSPFS